MVILGISLVNEKVEGVSEDKINFDIFFFLSVSCFYL